MVALNQKLRALGIEQTVELPQICVVGDQSAGKSSLIEALSKIKVPRAADCCTQCPLEINLIRNDDPAEAWKCTVSLQKRYKYSPDRAKDVKRPMGPWEELSEITTIDFAETCQRDDVCDIVRRAQLAILNPSSKNHQTEISQYEVMFSPNVVRLDILQDEVCNLSFIDLPGMVSHCDQNETLVSLIDNLVHRYSTAKRTY